MKFCPPILDVLFSRQEAVIISGRKLARQIRSEARADVEDWVAAGNRRPHLSVVLVGDNPASHSYVLNKTRAAAEVGKTVMTASNFNKLRRFDQTRSSPGSENRYQGILGDFTRRRSFTQQCFGGLKTQTFEKRVSKCFQVFENCNVIIYL